jgi:pimeloyl-ACP methyl ester carboxylesterase
MEASPVLKADPIERVALRVVPDHPEVRPPEPEEYPEFPSLDGQFHPEQHHPFLDSLSRELRRLADVPQDVVATTIDLSEILVRETRERKLARHREAERTAIEHVNQRDFRGFERQWDTLRFNGLAGDLSPHHDHRFARMEFVAPETQRPHGDVEIIWIHGWHGRYESFAEQAKPSPLREFSHSMYNRPGTDASSLGLFSEEGYTPQHHFDLNVRLVEQQIDRALAAGREEVGLVGHSLGGIIIQSYLDYAAVERPDQLERLRAVMLNNTSSSTNVIEGSFLDRLPKSAAILRKVLEEGVEAGNRINRFKGFVADRLSRRQEEEAEMDEEAYNNLAEEMAEAVGEEFVEAVNDLQRVLDLTMSVGYIDKMVGGNARKDVYLASKGRAKQNSPSAMIYDGLSMLRVPKRPNLPHVDVPIFILTGGRDELLPNAGHTVAAPFIEARPDSHLVREMHFPDSGHCTQMNHPEAVNRLAYDLFSDPEKALATYGSREHYRLEMHV